MSNDKFKDYEHFGKVPAFLATYVHQPWVSKKINKCDPTFVPAIARTGEMVSPRPNTLGQMRDYNMVSITTEFCFGDPVRDLVSAVCRRWTRAGKPRLRRFRAISS